MNAFMLPPACGCQSMNRRGLLGAMAGLGLAGLAGSALGQAAPSTPARSIIDTHHHLMPPAYLAAKRPVIEAEMPGLTATLGWTPQWTLDHLEKTGARAAILSLSTPGSWFGDDMESRKLTRIVNDYGAGLVRDHPDRLGLFASIAYPDVEGSLKEIEYAFDTLKADGVGMMTSYGDWYPGDPKFTPIWEELNRRKAVVYFHPKTPACCWHTVKGIPPSAVEFGFDTTRAITSLLVGLVLTRFTDITFLFSHGGGTLPFQADRIGHLASLNKENAAQMRGGPVAELRRLNFDTASITNAYAWAALTAFVPDEQIFFGTDFPFGSIATVRDDLHDRLGVTGKAYESISHGNAERILPRFRPAVAT